MAIGSIDTEAALAAFIQQQVEQSRVSTVARQLQNPAAAKGAFSAYRSVAVSYVTGSLVAFDAEEVDVSSWFDTATGRFTPQVAGLYDFNWSVRSNVVLTADQFWVTTLRKNGVAYKNGQIAFQRGTVGLNSAGTAMSVPANGTTDVFDITIGHNVGAAAALLPGAADTYFQGHFVGTT